MSPDVGETPGAAALRWIRKHRWLLASAGGVVAATAALLDYALLRPVMVVSQATNARLAMAGIRSRYLLVNGYRIHYYESGPAGGTGLPPVILVHGLGSTAGRWASLMMQLTAAHRRVYALDLLGYGESAKPKDASYSIPEEAGIVEGFLHAKGIGEYDLCGWSMGGWVALRVALKQNRSAPCRVRRLVLFNSAGLTYKPDWDPELFVPDTPAKFSALVQLAFPMPLALPGFVKTDLFRQARRDGWIIKRSLNSMLRGLDVVDDRLSELKMPVLIVWGKQDRIVPLSIGERMHAAMPQSVLDIYDGCGHLGPVQYAGRIGPRVISFLNAEPPETGGVNYFQSGAGLSQTHIDL